MYFAFYFFRSVFKFTDSLSKTAGKFRSNGEAAVFLGDANFSQSISYVPAGCGFPDRTGYRVPLEVVSVPWVKVGTANARGLINFRTQVAECGTISGSGLIRGAAVEVMLAVVVGWVSV